MALAELRYWSPTLQKQTAAMVVFPEHETRTGPNPVLYLLHGLGADYSDMLRETSIERYVADLPLIVVMPDGGRGWYVDAVEGQAYDTAITHDLLGLIDRTFPTDPRREARALAGMSMGGTGAVGLALRHPDLFCSAASHAGWWGPGFVDFFLSPESRRISGPTPWFENPHNSYVLAQQSAREALSATPALRLDCGTEDVNLQENRAFHAYLDSIGIAHEYVEYPGSHNMAYCDARLPDALAFHARVLGIT
jgi:putative tributyrin esterase